MQRPSINCKNLEHWKLHLKYAQFGKLNDQYTSTMPQQFPVWALYGQKTGLWYTQLHL